MHDRRTMRRIKEIENSEDRLIGCKEKEKVKIVSIDAGRGAVINLMNLGLNVGDTIEIRRKSRFHGPVIVVHRESEIAIGFGLAQKIIVKRIP